jgi:flavodoxin
MKACVIFDTRYGNTEKIARALEAGLGKAGIQTVCVNVKDVDIGSLNQYDLICVGGPTQYRTASETMQSFLKSLRRADLAGRAAFAFGTRRGSPLAGSAARCIEEALIKQGMKIASQRASATMVSPEPERRKEEFENEDQWKEWKHKSERLQEGEERRFEQTGIQIGRSLPRATPAKQ